MIDDVVDALCKCRSEQEFWRVHIRAENTLTPMEMAALIEFSDRLPPPTQEWLRVVASYAPFADAAPQRFCRQPIAPNIDVYRDPFVVSEQKRLILGFCGGANRLMMPITCILQYLPSDLCDLVVLRDRARLHYTRGISPYAESLSELVHRVAADLGAKNYLRTFCYGTSMGGFAALKAGILLKADAAISIGGRPAWHPPRLLRTGTKPIPAFDPLCDCNSATTTKLVCYYGAENTTDLEDAEHLSRILPVTCIAVPDTSEHNIIYALWRKGRLKAFYDRVFELSRPSGG